jgi:hypothetical protein
VLAYTREKLMESLLEVSALINLYQGQDAAFLPRTLQWMNDTEAALKQLRSPLSAMCASERGQLLAAIDGFRETDLNAREGSPRKAARAMCALCLGRVEASLRQRVSELDAQLSTAAEKMAQLLALASTRAPLPLPPTEPPSQWLTQVWQHLGSVAETRHLHAYLSSLLSADDRQYLLGQATDHLLAAMPPQ